MSYHGYIPYVKSFISQLKHPPAVIEIGIDRGTTLIPLTTFLARTRQQFVLIGVDILVQESLSIILNNLDLQPQQQCRLIQQNSLTLLPMLVQEQMKFDVVLIDGDHNYHTVKKELKFLNDLTHKHSMVIIDDVYGRWENRDMWYSEREGYENVEIASQKVLSEKQGCNAAVNEFLENDQSWQAYRFIATGEPVVLLRT